MADAFRPRRSALYLPASNPRAIAKARMLPCDVVILDLEDAVAPEAKPAAREAAAAAIRAGGWGHRELILRVNAADTAWGEAEMAMAAAVRPDAVLIPKVDRLDDIASAAARLDGIALWAMIEAPAALLALDAIAAAPGLAALVIGTNDLAAGLRVRPGVDRQPLYGLLAQTVVAARAHGLVVLDGVCNALDDPVRLAGECAQGRDLGFDGKTLVHPDQIDACNAAFSPTADEIAAAERIVAAFARAPGAAVLRVDGRMVERLHLAEAERALALSRAVSPDAVVGAR